jgi:nucleoside-diphosphate-sugar epimerase
MKNYPLALVTGANGWLGYNLVTALARGLAERPDLPAVAPRLRFLILPGTDTKILRQLAPDAEIIEGDQREPAARARFFEGAEGAVLFHLVGIIHPNKIRELYEINFESARDLLRDAAARGVGRAVVISSNSTLGCNPHPDHLFTEESPYHPYMNYGRSKMLLEFELTRLVAEGKMECVTIRPPWFYGPYQPPRQVLFFRMIRDGKAPVVGSGENRRSMAYLTNLAQGLVLAALTPQAAGQTYWIADERPYTMNEIVDTVERLLETEFGQKCAHKRLRLPGLASEVALAVDWTLQSVGLYHQKIHVLSEMNKTIACSVEKAKRELGYTPAISLEEGMRRSLRDCPEFNPQPAT